MDIATLPDWLWVKNPIYIDFGQQAANSLKFAKIQIWDDTLMLCEGLYVARNDYMKADISGFASKLFDLIPNENITTAETYRNLTIKVLVNSTETEIYNQLHTFVFGGKEPADLFDITDFMIGTTCKWLTEFDRPAIFEGYPFEVRFMKEAAYDLMFTSYDHFGNQIEAQTYSVAGNGASRNILKTKLITDSGIATTDVKYFILKSDYNADLHCDYVSPIFPGGVYLRWVNRLGGIDQYYFFLKDTRKPIKTTSVPVPQSLDFTNNWNPGVGKVVDKEKSTVLTIGAYQVPINDYEVIARISQSERVDMYTSDGKWIQVIVNDIDWNIAHENDYQDIEFSITTI